jgi:hypothetical protein
MMVKFVSMKGYKGVFILLSTIFMASSCMVLDGGNSYRAKNKCCGIIKCDIHRRSQLQNHKKAVGGHKSLQKKEQRIKRGY